MPERIALVDGYGAIYNDTNPLRTTTQLIDDNGDPIVQAVDIGSQGKIAWQQSQACDKAATVTGTTRYIPNNSKVFWLLTADRDGSAVVQQSADNGTTWRTLATVAITASTPAVIYDMDGHSGDWMRYQFTEGDAGAATVADEGCAWTI